MKTIQVAYLENMESRKWMQKNITKQGQSKFIREAVATKIAHQVKLDSKKKKSSNS